MNRRITTTKIRYIDNAYITMISANDGIWYRRTWENTHYCPQHRANVN